jgi:hypothetical protein
MRIRKSNCKKEEKNVFISSLLQQCITLTTGLADEYLTRFAALILAPLSSRNEATAV